MTDLLSPAVGEITHTESIPSEMLTTTDVVSLSNDVRAVHNRVNGGVEFRGLYGWRDDDGVHLAHPSRQGEQVLPVEVIVVLGTAPGEETLTDIRFVPAGDRGYYDRDSRTYTIQRGTGRVLLERVIQPCFVNKKGGMEFQQHSKQEVHSILDRPGLEPLHDLVSQILGWPQAEPCRAKQQLS